MTASQSGTIAPADGRFHLLTVVKASKREGSSPTGLVCRRLAMKLIGAGERVRVLAEPEQSHGWPAGVELVQGSIAHPLDHADVFVDVAGLALCGADPATVHLALAAAAAGGVQRVVLLSSHGPEYEQVNPPETWHWLAIEKAVESSGIAWTHIRPSAVMGAIIEGTYPATGSDWPHTIRTEGVVREAFMDDGHYPFIHESDLAAVMAAALRSDRFTGTIVEAVGLALSSRARVRSIAAALGRDIDAFELTAAESRAIWRRAGWPDEAIDVTLYALEQYGTRRAELTEWTLRQRPSVQEIIGRPPRSYDRWAADNAHLFR